MTKPIKIRENHSIFTTSESYVNSLGNWDFGICLGWFWCLKISKKSFLIEKNSFLVNLRHFYNIYLNIVKNSFSIQKFFGGPKKNIVIVLGGVVLSTVINDLSRPGDISQCLIFFLAALRAACFYSLFVCFSYIFMFFCGGRLNSIFLIFENTQVGDL